MTYIDETRTRVSSESAYLTKEVLARPNLKVVVNATVTKILTERVGTEVKAVGVEFAHQQDGPRFRVRSKREVIVSAGAVNSPQARFLPMFTFVVHSTDLAIDSYAFWNWAL